MQILHDVAKAPLYQQIYRRLKSDIQSGKLPANTKLSSKRKMAEQLGVSVNTVDAAYGQLLCEGFITSKPKSGFYVCELEALTSSKKDLLPTFAPKKSESIDDCRVDFAITGVDREGFPYSTWRKLMRGVFNEYDENLLSRSPFQGEEELREALCDYLYMSRGVPCRPEQIVVGAGTDNLLQILSYLLDNHCTIAMENPVYHESYLFFRRMGHNVLPVPIDRHGIPVAPLSNMNDIAVYITPAHQFPLGITMPISRRIQLLNWASNGSSRYLIEDDYDSEFRYNTKPVPAMKSIDSIGRVIYLGSFSRTISPALRISYMVLPEELLSSYLAQCSAFGCGVSKLDQLILTQFLTAGHFETHLNKMRKTYKEKREKLVCALKNAFGKRISIRGENAGQHVLVKLSGDMSEEQMCECARKVGVRVYPISPYFMGDMPTEYQGIVLLGYATLSESEIYDGVKRLKSIW